MIGPAELREKLERLEVDLEAFTKWMESLSDGRKRELWAQCADLMAQFLLDAFAADCGHSPS